MKFTIKTMAMLLIMLGLQIDLNAQGIKTPQASTGQTIIQDFALGKITVVYSRPNVKGRTVFGDMEPFGKVWRTGANNATLIKFTDAVKVEGKDLPAGEYGLFSIPGKNEWTIIFNKNPKQWGSYTYDEKDDVLRVKVKPNALNSKEETFSIQFANVLPTTAQLVLAWEKTSVAVNLSTSIDAEVMASIAEAMKGEKKPYFQAAQYYFENGKDLKTALEWMNEAEKAAPTAPHIKLWKGRIELKMGDKIAAQKTAQAGLTIATETKNDEYIRLCGKLLADTKK